MVGVGTGRGLGLSLDMCGMVGSGLFIGQGMGIVGYISAERLCKAIHKSLLNKPCRGIFADT